MKRLELLYPFLPVQLQNVAVSTQGWIFRRQRYSGEFRSKLAEVVKNASRSKEESSAFQFASLAAFLKHAADTSDFYRERFRGIGFGSSDLRSLADLRNIPILEKNDLRTQTAEIRSIVCEHSAVINVHTSGTSGSPIHVAYTPDDMRMRMAFLHRMLLRHGVSPMARSVRFSGRTLFPQASKNNIFWRHNWPMNQLLMSSYNLHPDRMDTYVDRIARFKPELIDGYPSSIYVIARHINATGQRGRILPKVVMTTAETLEDHQRAEISDAFGGCRVANQYASSEGAPFITEDEYGDLVVNTDTGVFEYVKPGTDEIAADGELAELLVTSFTTHAYPLIRYRIGDAVLLPEKPRLARSWGMPIVERIVGRQEDILFTSERGYVGRLDPIFKKSPSTIVESQIVQTAQDAITLRVVPDLDAGYDDSHLEGVLHEIRARLGNVTITIEKHGRLPRGANGKFRAVIGLGNVRGI